MIDSKLSAYYWINKIDNRTADYKVVDIKLTKKIQIGSGKLSYFYKLTGDQFLAQYTIILALYNVLIKRYFSATDALIFSPNIFKNNAVVNEKNPLLLLTKIDKDYTLKQFINRVKEEVRDVYGFADYDINAIQKRTGYQNFEHLTPYGLFYNVSGSEKSPGNLFSLNVNKHSNKDLEISIGFSENFTNANTAHHFLNNFKEWMTHLEDYMNVPLDEIPVLSDQEIHQLLYDFNAPRINYPTNKTIVDLFAVQALKTPDTIAVIFEDKILTYKELDEKSNQFSHYLLSNHRIELGGLIGVKTARSQWLLISLLGILKTGAAYVPIDPEYPEKRIEFIEKDANCRVTVNESLLEHFRKEADQHPASSPKIPLTSSGLAYIIYTSGSTGNPKGVMIRHANATAMIHWAQEEYRSTPFDVIYAVTSHCFDLSVYELFFPLSIGKSIRILKSGLSITEYLTEDKNILINTVPSVMLSLLEKGADLSNVAAINLAGEAFPPELTSRLDVLKTAVRNLYGPSEDTTYSSCFKIEKAYEHNVPIGKPISNTYFYIVSEDLRLQPIGVPGELCIGGDGLAAGYLNQPELTAESFVPDPFKPGKLIYKTGDLACWLSDGNIEFLGRKDAQVKLRGYRIEPGEIESAIHNFSEDVKQIVVAVKQFNGEDVLAAYYTGRVDKSDLRSYLSRSLPDYMVPSYFVQLNSLPLTPNGKIDKKALPDISRQDSIRKRYVGPKNDTEHKIAEIWSEVLGIEKIGIGDNFFELGGHSLMVSQVINRLYKELGSSVTFREFFTHPTIGQLSKKLQKSDYAPIPQAPKALYYPITASQRRMWVLSQLEGGSLAYNISGGVIIKGALAIHLFESSFRNLITRHEILRTSFKADAEGEVHQYIMAPDSIKFEIKKRDYSMEKNGKDLAGLYLEAQENLVFDLEGAPLLRASLLKIKEKEYLFFLSLHHIIGDGWSIEILMSELIRGYNELLHKKTIELPDLTVQYKDYTIWLLEQSEKEHYQSSGQYWSEQLKGNLPVLDLPAFKPRPPIKTYNGEVLFHSYPDDFSERLNRFAKAHEVSLFMVLMAGVNALLHRYTGQGDIILGTPIAGRDHPDLEHQLGLYLNTLAVRTRIDKGISFLDLLIQEKDLLLAAYEHQDYPFDELVGKLNVKRDKSRSPIFDVMVVLQNQEQLHNMNTAGSLSELQVTNYTAERKRAQFDITYIFTAQEGLALNIEYNTDIYDRDLTKQMAVHFQNLLTQAMEAPEKPIEKLDCLNQQEKHQLLTKFNGIKVDYPENKTIVDLLEDQVKNTPDNIAVVFENTLLSYRELNERSNQLGDYLRSNYKIKAGDLIGINLERDEWILIAIVGILKAGGAYVPIDPDYPAQRIAYIKQDSNCNLILDKEELKRFIQTKESYSKENLTKINQPHDLAYVIYTSGSTGNPKGVMISHNNAVGMLRWAEQEYKNTPFDIVYAATSYCFDLSVYEFFYPLSIGKHLRILKSSLSIGDYLAEDKNILLNTVPSVIRSLLEKGIAFNHVVAINMAGEAIPVSLIKRLSLKSIEVRNLYGPSEDTTYSSCFKVDKEYERSIPIGKPISNTTFYIVSEALQLQPQGVAGELCISGSGLSRGYLNKPELTKEKFIENPFVEGERMYKTGDLARWLPDGTMEFIGRKDHQVKIRGYRIELGEIEHHLLQHESIEEVVVLDRRDSKGEKNLVAYITSKENLNSSKLIHYLKKVVPYYMVPSYFVQLAELPLTPNGKLDRKKLPKPEGLSMATGLDYIAPGNEAEEKLVAIWSEILEISQEKIGIKDNFFELGGHSLKAIMLMSRIYKVFEVNLELKDLFTHETLEEQALLIGKTPKTAYSAINPAPEQLNYTLSSAQERLWILSQFEEGNTAYNMPAVYEFKGILDKTALENAFSDVITRHEALRTVFKEDEEGIVKQYIRSVQDQPFTINYLDIRKKENKEETIHAIIQEEIINPFNLATGPLLRVRLIQTDEDAYIFTYVMHHIISDGWSMEVLIRDLLLLYNAHCNGKENPLTPLSIQYKDYAAWHRKQLSGTKLSTHKTFWKDQFKNGVPTLDFPLKKSRPTLFSYKGDSIEFSVDQENMAALIKMTTDNDATLFTSLVYIIKILLHKYTGQHKIMVGTSYAGRNHAALEDQIGLYINNFPLITDIKSEETIIQTYEKVKNNVVAALNHSMYPFDMLIDDIDYKIDKSRPGLFNVLIELHNNTEHNINEKLTGLHVIPVPVTSEKSLFDLSFEFFMAGGRIDTLIIYNTDLFNAGDMELLKHRFNRLLSEITDATHNNKMLKIEEIMLYSIENEINNENDDLLKLNLEENF